MKVTKLNLGYVAVWILFLLGSIHALAQNKLVHLQEIAAKTYTIGSSKMSENGHWIAIQKKYDDRKMDSVMVFNTQKAKAVITRANINNFWFVDYNHLLLCKQNQVELLNLEKQTSRLFKNVAKYKYLESTAGFVLYFNMKEKNKIEIYNSSGELLNRVERVNSFYSANKGSVFVVRKNKRRKTEVLKLKDKSTTVVYTTLNSIKYLEIDPDEKGFMVHERNLKDASWSVTYIDLKNHDTYALKDLLSLNIKSVLTEVVETGEAYFLHVFCNPKKKKDTLVDIWYGNDNQLEEKDYDSHQEKNFIWKPKRKSLHRIGNTQFIQNVPFGSSRYFLSFDPYALHDYTMYDAPIMLNSYDVNKRRYRFVDTLNFGLSTSRNGEYILAAKNDQWCSYNIPEHTKTFFGNNCLKKPYFSRDHHTVWFDGYEGVWKYDLKDDNLNRLQEFEGYKTTILNATSNSINSFHFFNSTIDNEESLLLKLYNPRNNKTAYVLWDENKIKTIIPPTANRIQCFTFNDEINRFTYIEENVDLPPRLMYKEFGEKEKQVFLSNKSYKENFSIKQEIIPYSNSEGRSLKGVLYYPMQYDPSKKYPMVVHVYQIQHHLANHYLTPSLNSNGVGFDIRFLLKKGYFVYLPDIVYGKKGTGVSALDCVNSALDALMNYPTIKASKIGLMGHSHGGYETNFIATHSKRFATYIAGAGNSDIVRSYFSFNNNFRSPFYWQYENGQYEMGVSFQKDKKLYFRNNPIYNVEQVNVPILLWTGKEDQNIYWEQTMEFYIGLKRNKKKVIALFYPNEGHSMKMKAARQDLVIRTLDWFDYFLKEKKNIEWINLEMNKDAL